MERLSLSLKSLKSWFNLLYFTTEVWPELSGGTETSHEFTLQYIMNLAVEAVFNGTLAKWSAPLDSKVACLSALPSYRTASFMGTRKLLKDDVLLRNASHLLKYIFGDS